MRLVVLTATELTRDARARRQLSAARRLGLDVVGVSGLASGEPPMPVEGVEIHRVGPQGRVRRDPLGDAPQRRVIVREVFGLLRLARLVVRTARLARGTATAGSVDIVHANDRDTLPAGWLVARRKRARLVYDAHELYSAFEQHPPRLATAVLTALERALARRVDAVVTVSDALAEELTNVLRLRRRPLVVANAPELRAREPAHGDGPLRAVYQGAFGPGRYPEDFLDALAEAPGVTLAIRVVGVDADTLRADVERRGLAERVTVLAPVAPDELVGALDGCDVGLIVDRPRTRNSELSFPNRLFDYLMAGLAVVTSRLGAVSSFVEAENVGVVFAPGKPSELAARLRELDADRPRLAELQRRARDLAVSRFNAEAQDAVLADAWGVSASS